MTSKNAALPEIEGGYIPSLDGLRAVSMFLVFMAHAFPGLRIPSGFGVTVFFFISGYLITTLLYREHEKTGRISFRKFYERRVLRLAPPLFVALSIGICFVLLGWLKGTLNPVGLASQTFFFFNYWRIENSAPVIEGLDVLWSLSVEEHFYLIFPLMLLVAIKRNWPAWWMIVGCIAVLFWRTYKALVMDQPDWLIYSLTDTRLDSMLWGCFLAALIAQRSRIPGFILTNFTSSLIFAVVLLIASFAVRSDDFRTTLLFTVQGIALIPIFVLAIYQPERWPFVALNWRAVRVLGVYSYTLYLVHRLMLETLKSFGMPVNGIGTALIGAILAIGIAALVHRFIERPIKVWRDKLRDIDLDERTPKGI